MKENVNAGGDEAETERATEPCVAWLVYLITHGPELIRAVEPAGGEAITSGIRDIAGAAGNGVAAGVGEEVSYILAEKGDVFTDA